MAFYTRMLRCSELAQWQPQAIHAEPVQMGIFGWWPGAIVGPYQRRESLASKGHPFWTELSPGRCLALLLQLFGQLEWAEQECTLCWNGHPCWGGYFQHQSALGGWCLHALKCSFVGCSPSCWWKSTPSVAVWPGPMCPFTVLVFLWCFMAIYKYAAIWNENYLLVPYRILLIYTNMYTPPLLLVQGGLQ